MAAWGPKWDLTFAAESRCIYAGLLEQDCRAYAILALAILGHPWAVGIRPDNEKTCPAYRVNNLRCDYEKIR